MSLPLACDQSSWISIGTFRPRPFTTSDDVVVHFSSLLTSLGCANFAILKSLSNQASSWVAFYAIWAKETGADNPADIRPPLADTLANLSSQMAEPVDLSWYEISCFDRKEAVPFPTLSKGDVVHLRAIIGEPELQEMLSYSCLAILKAYFQKAEGLMSCMFYKSMDKRRITGVGIWKDVKAAYDFFSARDGSPGERFWRSVGAELRYGIYRVVSVTYD